MATRDKNGRFVKGASGNPGGKPVTAVRELLDSAVTPADWVAVIIKLRDMALRGDIRAAEVLLDRRFGKAVQRLAGEDGPAIKTESVVVYIPDNGRQQGAA